MSRNLGPENIDPLKPEHWAAESVQLLWERMLFAGTVNRDFENTIANYGDEVNTRRPDALKAKRKQNDRDDLEIQDVSMTNIKVRLNQRVYSTFQVGDAELSLPFKDLVTMYLDPAVMACAQVLDRALAGQVYQFLANRAGGLKQMTKTNSHDYLLDLRKIFNDNKTDPANRWLALASNSETLMQKNEMFKQAYSIGDAGQALRDAILGRVASWNTFLELNVPSTSGSWTDTTRTVDGAVAAGATSLNVDVITGIAAGDYVVVEGDYTPLKVVTVSSVTITFNRPLLRDVADGAKVYKVPSGTINQASAIAKGDTTAQVSNGYPAGWAKGMVVDGGVVPLLSQLVSFGATSTVEYCIIDVTNLGGGNYEILLDRPLAEAIADNGKVCYGPVGDYNFGYQRNALTLVSRPLATPRPETGVRAAIGMHNGMALRVEISRNSTKQTHVVTVDGIFGISVLDENLGAVLLG